MRVDDLRRSLDAIAEEAQAKDSASQLRDVEARIRHHRRNRAVGTAVGAAALAGLLALAVPGLSSDESAPPVTDPPPVDTGKAMEAYPTVPTVEKQGLSAYESLRGAPLLGYEASAPGDKAVELTFVPTSSDLVLSELCTLGPDPEPSTIADDYTMNVYVNGHYFVGEQCNGRYGDRVGENTDSGGGGRAANQRMWEDDYDVVVGAPTTITALMRGPSFTGPAVSVTDAQLALAVYEAVRATTRLGGVMVDRTIQYGQHVYEVSDATSAVVEDGSASVQADTSAFDTPILVRFGNTGLSGSYRDNQDGTRARHTYRSGTYSEGHLQLVLRPDEQITFDVSGVDNDGGSILVAIYTPVAD